MTWNDYPPQKWEGDNFCGDWIIHTHTIHVYLPTFGWFLMVHVGKYTIHGDYGYDPLLEVPGTSSSTRLDKKEGLIPDCFLWLIPCKSQPQPSFPTSILGRAGRGRTTQDIPSKVMVQSSASPKLGCTSPVILLMLQKSGKLTSWYDKYPNPEEKNDFDSSHKVLLMERIL